MSGGYKTFGDLFKEIHRQVKGPKAGAERTNGHGRETAVVEDDVIIEKVRSSKSAAKFETLFDRGETYQYAGDSEADFALLGILRFWTQDPEQLKRIMRQSALCRERWDENHGGGETRIEYSIRRALDGDFDTYQWPEKFLSSSTSLRDDGDDETSELPPLEIVFFAELGEPKPREFLVEKIGVKGYPIVPYGAGGVAKSFAVLGAGVVIAGDEEDPRWLGLRILEQGHVLYIDFELDVDEQHRRVRDVCNGLGVPVPKRLAYLSGVGRRPEDVFRLARKHCKDHEAIAVVIDSMGMAISGDMDKNHDVLEFHARYVDPFRALGVTPFIVDHEGKLQAGEKHKNKAPIGGAFKAWRSRCVLQFQYEEHNPDTGELRIRVRHTKTNMGPLLEPFGIRFKFGLESVEMEPYELADEELIEEQTAPLKDRVYTLIKAEAQTVAGLVNATGAEQGTLYNVLSGLQRAGLVRGDSGRPKLYSVVSSSSPSPKGVNDDERNEDPDEGPVVDPNQTTIDDYLDSEADDGTVEGML